MTDMLRAVILGIVEGLTEFLPISSTGHMILTMPLLDIPPKDPFWNGSFDIFIQVGAILAVVVYFWRRLTPLALHRGTTPLREHILVKLMAAFMPAAVLGLATSDVIEAHLKFPLPVAAALIVGGIGIIVIEQRNRAPRVTDAARVTLMQAVLIGCAQCFALWPGMSRSAATIMGGLLIGLSAPAAAEFSFFLAIPTMGAAGAYALLKHADEIDRSRVMLLAVGFVVSFVVAWLVVAAFMRFIQTHRFRPFAIYRIVIGVVVLAAIGLGWLSPPTPTSAPVTPASSPAASASSPAAAAPSAVAALHEDSIAPSAL